MDGRGETITTLKALTALAHLQEFLAGTQRMSGVPDFDVQKDPRPGPNPRKPSPHAGDPKDRSEPINPLFGIRQERAWRWIA